MLEDVDLALVAVLIPEGKTEEQARADGDLDVPMWEVMAWIGVDGPARWVERAVADDGPDLPSPERSCMRLDAAVTA